MAGKYRVEVPEDIANAIAALPSEVRQEISRLLHELENDPNEDGVFKTSIRIPKWKLHFIAGLGAYVSYIFVEDQVVLVVLAESYQPGPRHWM